eukprot:g26843.t1
MGDYLEMVRHLTQVAEQEKRAPMEGTPSRMDCLGHLQVEIEALSMEGPPSESKEARLAALQRVLAERSLREAPEAFQVQQLVALRQAQEASLAAWGFACEEDLAAAPCYLLRLHGDPMLTGCLAYVITGSRILGSSGDIFLQGLGIAPQHCHIAEHSGGLWLTNLCSEPHRVFLNGKSMEATSPAEPLKHGDRIQLGCALEMPEWTDGFRTDRTGLSMLVVMNENLKNLDLEALEAGDLWSRPLDALVQQANELLKELELLQVSNQHSHFEVPEVDGGASPVRFVRWEHSERESGEVESALWHKEKAVAASIRRAHSLSQCIGETVSALQETVADLRRGAAGAFTPVEAFEKLQDENQDLKQRLARLESHWAETWKPSSQRSSAAVPSEPSTASALSAATSVDRLRSARPRAVPRPSVVVRSGRMSSPVPTRAEPVAGPYLMRRTLPVPKKGSNVQEASELLEELLARHSRQLPPFSVGIFSQEDVSIIRSFVTRSFLRHFKMFQFMYKQQQDLHLCTVARGVVPQVPKPCSLHKDFELDPNEAPELAELLGTKAAQGGEDDPVHDTTVDAFAASVPANSMEAQVMQVMDEVVKDREVEEEICSFSGIAAIAAVFHTLYIVQFHGQVEAGALEAKEDGSKCARSGSKSPKPCLAASGCSLCLTQVFAAPEQIHKNTLTMHWLSQSAAPDPG